MAKQSTGRAPRPGSTGRPARSRRVWMPGLGALAMSAAIVGSFAYRAGADLPGVKLEDQGDAQFLGRTAWTRLGAFDDFDGARTVRFIRAYRGIDHHKG